MFKRINWKSVFKCFAWLVSLGGIVTLMSFVEVKKHTVRCTNIKILIPGADNFIEREEIDAILKQNEGQLIGRSLEDINLNAIEGKIKANPYIALSTVYADMDGVIHIEISQRQPIMRVINAGGQDFYIDRDGLKMPVSPNFTANVLVANGHILEHYSGKVDTLITKMCEDLYKTALFLKKDTLWDAQIEQIFVNDRDDIELVPRVGNQRIILGTADSLETKMTNLLTFYKEAMPKVGWDTYKTINIKYSNQIVCEKNKPDSIHGSFAASPARPTVAGVKSVMDSIVKAEVASELRNNPEENSVMTVLPEKKVSAPVVKPAPKPVVKPAVKPEVKKTAVPVVKKPEAAVKKPEATAKKPEASAKKPEAAAKKTTEVKKTETTVKKATAEVKKAPATTKPAENKTVKPAEKKETKPAEKTTAKPAEKKAVKPAHTSAMPEIRWIKPVAKPVKKTDNKDTRKNK